MPEADGRPGPSPLKQHTGRARHDAEILRAVHIVRTGGAHGVALASPRLAVSKHAHIIPLHEGLDARRDILPDGSPGTPRPQRPDRR